MEKFGIENLKPAVTGLAKLASDLVEAFADGKFTLTEGISIAVGNTQVATAISNPKALLDEIKDLSETEAEELSDHVATALDLPSDRTEQCVELAVEAALKLNALAVLVTGNKDGEADGDLVDDQM